MNDTTLNPERRLLGAAMQFPTVVDEVTLDPADFSDPRYEALWSLMCDLRQKGRSTDPGVVLSALPQIPEAERVGIDGDHLLDLLRAAPATANEGEHAARDVANAAANRRIVSLGHRAVQLGEAGGDATQAQDLLRQEVETVSRATSEHVDLVGDTIDDTIKSFEEESPAIPTPWPDLNYFIRGWEPGALHTIGARPSVGKSIALLQAAVELARTGYVSFHSLEMTKRQVDQRLIAMLGSVSLARLRGKSDEPDKNLSDRDWRNIAKARAELADLKLSVQARTDLTVADIRARARAVARKGPLAAVVVDYLQLIDPPRHMEPRSRVEQVGYFSRALKAMAIEFNVPILAAVQLNRGSIHRTDPTPTMADIRESGAVEQDSDVILLLHSTGPENDPTPDLNMIVAKQRQGIKGVAELVRKGEFARFESRPWTPHRVLERM